MNVKLMAKQAQLQDIVDKVGGVGGREGGGGRGRHWQCFGNNLTFIWVQPAPERMRVLCELVQPGPLPPSPYKTLIAPSCSLPSGGAAAAAARVNAGRARLPAVPGRPEPPATGQGRPPDQCTGG